LQTKIALITGISGQDGRYLTESLVKKGYRVHGLMRSTESLRDLKLSPTQIQDQIQLHAVDYSRPTTIPGLIANIAPTEIYHLASPSFVSYQLNEELQNFQMSFAMVHSLLAAVSDNKLKSRIYFAGTSEMFGAVTQSPQSETTEFRPRSLYGMAKVAAYHLIRSYRENHGVFVSCGILYNHESPRRAHQFVTRKITRAAASIKLGLATELRLGNLDVKRDWGSSSEYVEAMWKMLQVDQADDFIICTGKNHSLENFLDTAFSRLNLDWKKYVQTDPQYFRSGEKVPLLGSPEKAARILGWKAQRSFASIVEEMVDFDLAELKVEHSL
jgi:GDPmannose 4,6-dehydratase